MASYLYWYTLLGARVPATDHPQRHTVPIQVTVAFPNLSLEPCHGTSFNDWYLQVSLYHPNASDLTNFLPNREQFFYFRIEYDT